MTTVNITVWNDADFWRQFQYKAVDETPINLTGVSMVMMLRRRAADEAAMLRLGTDTGEISLVDPANGIFLIFIAQPVLLRLGLGDFDHSLVATLANGRVVRIWGGMFTNNAGPSR